MHASASPELRVSFYCRNVGCAPPASLPGEADALVSDHALYRGLGRSAAERQKAYRELFRARLPDEFLDAVRAATNGGWALGGDRFKRQIAKALGSPRLALPKGRPPKNGKGQAAIEPGLTNPAPS